MKKLALIAFMLFLAVPAFAGYGYHTNKYGTGYFRDDSNDGNQYNNANSIGLNSNRRSYANSTWDN